MNSPCGREGGGEARRVNRTSMLPKNVYLNIQSLKRCDQAHGVVLVQLNKMNGAGDDQSNGVTLFGHLGRGDLFLGR